MKTIRDIFLDFLSALSETELNFADVISDAFEQMHNTLTTATRFEPNATHACESDYEIYNIHIWELFICVTAYLRHLQNYKAIYELLNRTYFLTSSCLDSSVKPANYCNFYFYSSLVEDQYKPTTANNNMFTLLGHTICKEREKKPIYTGEALAEADLFLYQVTNAYQFTKNVTMYWPPYWFPTFYVYVKTMPIEWTKIKSRKYCEKMFDLFGVNSIDDLKENLKKCTTKQDRGYHYSFSSAWTLLECVKLEEIGSMN